MAAEATPAKPRPESASTLQTIVELVRRIMHADVASIVSFSLTQSTITWRAASGLQAHVVDDEHPLVQPITNEVARRSIAANATSVVEGIGVRDEFPARDFVVHAAEGVCDLAFTPLKARGKILGALIAGFRSAKFSRACSEKARRLITWPKTAAQLPFLKWKPKAEVVTWYRSFPCAKATL